MEAVRVTEHGGNIAEDDAFLRKIRNAGDILLNLTHETSISSLSLPPGRESIMLFCHLASKTAIHFIYYQIVSFVTRLIVRNVDFYHEDYCSYTNPHQIVHYRIWSGRRPDDWAIRRTRGGVQLAGPVVTNGI